MQTEDTEETYLNPLLDDLNNSASATDAYRSAMTGIGSSLARSSQQVKSKTQKTRTNCSALIREDEYVDDWLIDDLQPMKRRKMDVNGLFSTGTSKTGKKKSRSSEESNHRTEERRKSSGKAARCRIEDSDIESDGDSDSVTMDTEIDSDITDNPLDKVDKAGSMTNGIDNDKTLTDDFSDFVLDIDSDSEIPPINGNKNSSKINQVHRNSAKANKPKQTKITTFGTRTGLASVSDSEPAIVNLTSPVERPSTDLADRITDTSNSGFAQQNSAQSSNSGGLAGVIRVKVQIKDKLLLIPILDRFVLLKN